MTNATMTNEITTVLVTDLGDVRHTVAVRQMESGFNYEVILDGIRIASQVNPYTAREIHDGLTEFFFDQGFTEDD